MPKPLNRNFLSDVMEDDEEDSVCGEDQFLRKVEEAAEKLTKSSTGADWRRSRESDSFSDSDAPLPERLPKVKVKPKPAPPVVSDFQILDEKMNFLIEIALKNIKYSKAVYATTKKSINGPGHEVGALSRLSVTGGGMLERGGSRLSIARSMIEHTSTGRSSGGLTVGFPSKGLSDKTKSSLGLAVNIHNSQMSQNSTWEDSRLSNVGSMSVTRKVTNMLELNTMINQQSSRKTVASLVGKNVWRFMEDRSSSRLASVYAVALHVLLAASTIMACVDVIDLNIGEDGPREASPGARMRKQIAVSIESCFLLELGLRFACSPHRRFFFYNKFNCLDAVSTLPLIVRVITFYSEAFGNSSEVNAFLCLVPVLRLCKLLRHFETFHLLTSAFRTSFEALPVILFTLFLLVLTFSALIYYVEPRSHVKNFGLAIWFVLVTMCGVAPGDPIPLTYAGKACTMILIGSGLLYISIPIGIVGTAFSHVWEDRTRLLLLHRMRSCVERAGYTPTDLMAMFKVLDSDGNGSLDFEEFAAMLTVMNLEIEEKFAMEVFESFDTDCEGSIDFRELLMGLFPMATEAIMESLLERGASSQYGAECTVLESEDTFSISPAKDRKLIGRQNTSDFNGTPGNKDKSTAQRLSLGSFGSGHNQDSSSVSSRQISGGSSSVDSMPLEPKKVPKSQIHLSPHRLNPRSSDKKPNGIVHLGELPPVQETTASTTDGSILALGA